MRITQSILRRNAIANITQGTERIGRLQEMIATGRKVLRPSDDPAAARGILGERGRLSAIEAYLTSISRARALMNVMEDALAAGENLVVRARELTLQGLNAPTDLSQREALALEVDSLRASLLNVGNTSIEGKYLFGGTQTTTAPFAETAKGVVYQGDDQSRQVAPSEVERIDVTMSGRHALGVVPAEIASSVDLNPALSPFTPLRDLHRGTGMVSGSVRITDSNGTTAIVDLSGAASVDDVLDLLNAAPVSITASIATDGTGLVIDDWGSGTTLTIEEEGSGTAEQLGIRGTSDTGTIVGTDLDPRVSLWNPLALLNGGAGITPGQVHLENSISTDSRTADLDLSGVTTLGELVHRLETATTPGGESMCLTLEIAEDGATLRLGSTLPERTLVLEDLEGGTLGAQLGLAGRTEAQDLFNLLSTLADELRAGEGDPEGHLALCLSRLEVALERVLSARAEIGVRVGQLERIEERLQTQKVEVSGQIDALEGTDLASAITDLTLAETTYEAALGVTGRILPISLFDYLS